jgi:hypothetical protein
MQPLTFRISLLATALAALAACTGTDIEVATDAQPGLNPMQPSEAAAQTANLPLLDLETRNLEGSNQGGKIEIQTATFALG